MLRGYVGIMGCKYCGSVGIVEKKMEATVF